jgi:hypothetical protein
MQDLINLLTEKAGISQEQAAKSIETIKDYVKEKFPMMAGAVDNLLGSTPANTASETTPAENSGGNILDKISNVIPGEAGQKVEDFAKNAAHQAEDAFDSVKDKLSGLFGGNH